MCQLRLNQHLRSCYRKKKITDVQTRYEINENDENDQTSDYSNIEIPDISAPSLRYKWAIINIICLREFSFLLTKK